MLIAGVDEVGYGALVGDLIAAAVILPTNHGIKGIKDSKQLTPKQREALYTQICAKAIAFNIAAATHSEIDQLNVLQANLLAMQRAVIGLSIQPDKVLVDGNKCPDLPYPVEAIVGGDATVIQISAASIIAKVWARSPHGRTRSPPPRIRLRPTQRLLHQSPHGRDPKIRPPQTAPPQLLPSRRSIGCFIHSCIICIGIPYANSKNKRYLATPAPESPRSTHAKPE